MQTGLQPSYPEIRIMKRTTGAALIGLCLIAPLCVAAAQELYVTDRLEITLRSGPGVDYKILAMIPSGTALNRLEEAARWSRVQTGDGKEGWVVTRYLSNEPPKGPLLQAARDELQALRVEYDHLKERLNSAADEGNQASEQAEDYRARLEAVEQEFTVWKEKNKDVIALRARADALETAQEKDHAELDRLRVENRNLQAREKFYWFFSGVVVLLLGWVLGYFYASSRHRAKSQSRFRF